MKTELVESLINAHLKGDERSFLTVLDSLIADEEKNGDHAAAERLRKAEETVKKKSPLGKGAGASVIYPQQAVLTPRDKDSLLELFEVVNPDVSLSDVVLAERQKNVLEQIIVEQRNSEELISHGMTPINRLLLCGPPGCGKTMTAYALAHELGMEMAYVRFDGLVSSYLGQTSTNLRKVFDAVRNRRMVLFLDEFDAIAKKRDDENELGELKRVVTTLLQNFDNLSPSVFLIAATNHEHLLDSAVWRRFNLTLILGLPDEDERAAIIRKRLDKYGITEKIDVKKLARVTAGMNGSLIDEVMASAAKRRYLNGSISTDDIVSILIQHHVRYSSDSPDVMKAVSEMLDNGMSYRTVAEALGIPHSTLQYRVEKFRKEEKSEG